MFILGIGIDLGDTKKETPSQPFITKTQQIQYDLLDFPIEKLFLLGSPVGLFLLLRGLSIKPFIETRDENARPHCGSLYNIFHPAGILVF